MATRPTKEITARPPKEREPDEPLDIFSQRKRPEKGRYSLQVDRQVKQSFTDLAAAEAAGAAIKKKFPIVQVVVYDTEELRGIPVGGTTEPV
jgi:hypothetical protein